MGHGIRADHVNTCLPIFSNNGRSLHGRSLLSCIPSRPSPRSRLRLSPPRTQLSLYIPLWFSCYLSNFVCVLLIVLCCWLYQRFWVMMIVVHFTFFCFWYALVDVYLNLLDFFIRINVVGIFQLLVLEVLCPTWMLNWHVESVLQCCAFDFATS